MPSLIDEHTQYIDSSGAPIVNGKVYIGTRNQDPKTNSITIYSDRGLTTTISNPQTLDANGRTTNKIWVPSRHSIQVDNSSDVQQYQALDAGTEEQIGITRLTNVQGTNTITAEGTPDAVTSLVDGQQYNFKAANANTGTTTLQIDLTTAKTIKKLHDVDLASGDIEQNQVISVVYNSTDDVFELVSNISGASYTDLTISNNFTYGGVIQPSVSAQATDHVRCGFMQHYTGSTNVSFNVFSSVTEVTWESVGPTGSGADNPWSGIDVMPSNATAIILVAHLYIVGTGTDDAFISLSARQTGSSTTPGQSEKANVATENTLDNVAGGNSYFIVPLDANRRFDIYWDQYEASNRTITLAYHGFMTD